LFVLFLGHFDEIMEFLHAAREMAEKGDLDGVLHILPETMHPSEYIDLLPLKSSAILPWIDERIALVESATGMLDLCLDLVSLAKDRGVDVGSRVHTIATICKVVYDCDVSIRLAECVLWRYTCVAFLTSLLGVGQQKGGTLRRTLSDCSFSCDDRNRQLISPDYCLTPENSLPTPRILHC
jgi:hypothetical protein